MTSDLHGGALTEGATSLRLNYPQTERVDQVDTYHGVEVADPYRWLEDTTSAATAAWVEAENKVTHAYLEKLPNRQGLLDRLTELMNYPRYGQPVKRGDRYFYSKNDGLQNQAVWYVQASLGAESEVLLDPNTLSAEGTVAVSGFNISKDGSLVAYSLSSAGSDWQEFRIRDVASGKDCEEVVNWVKFSGASWTADNRGFYYSRFPEPEETQEFQEANLHHKIYYHVVGTPQSEDVLIYERPDEPEWRMNAYVVEEGDFLIISIGKTGPKNRVYYIDLGDPQNPNVDGTVEKLIDEFEASFGYIGHDGHVLYFETDYQALRGQVIAINLKQSERELWRTLIPESRDTLRNVSLSGNDFIATYLHSAFSEIRFFDLQGQFLKNLEMPALGTVGGLSGRRADTERFYTFTSYVHPPTIYRYDVESETSTIFRESEVRFSTEGYESYQVWFQSKDGTQVPMFVTHRAGLKLDGSNPTYLTGYGGFNISLTPGFSTSVAMWLENGGVFAVPNLRGGGEFGEAWHEAGIKERKQNVFDDFIGAAEYLIAEGYTSSEKLAIAGGSNGGLLMGAVVNQRPELFAVALPAVGVMDMLRFHKFTIGSAWIYDYGSSDDEGQFKALYAYSPVHNIKPGTHYPAVLVTTGDHDDRVVPGHSFKYAAALQAAQAGNAPTLIRIETKAGHGAGKPIGKILQEQADVWAFVMHHLGVRALASGG
ncbi:prolyl endopeptidase [Abditibacteriota bacterium]|nr:prolyl endopeptidase [Abditibacteriota bacterium]